MAAEACCHEGEKALSLVDFVDPPCTGYNCPTHGWQWVGDPPRCGCTSGEPGALPCPLRADGPDGLCRRCRDQGHMRGAP